MNEEIMMKAFQIIADAGDASAQFIKAIEEAENYKFDSAENHVEKGAESLTKAHQKQTELLHEEVKGKSSEYSLVMVHAQDHLMNAILLKELMKSIMKLNAKVYKLENQ